MPLGKAILIYASDLIMPVDATSTIQTMNKAPQASRNSAENLGEVFLVGAGPGDPDLLTIKALKLLNIADVILHDRLVSAEILSLANPEARLIDVGKECSKHTLPQNKINELLVELARNGSKVIRLTGGDPFIFGRGGEELEWLAKENVPFQIIPGVSAANGCAAYSGIPLTHRDHAQSVRFVTAHLKNNSFDLPWDNLVAEKQTLVFYMGLLSISIISKKLLEHGMAPDMPIALISNGTTPKQKILIANLIEIADGTISGELPSPTIIIVGSVVTLHKKLHHHSELKE